MIIDIDEKVFMINGEDLLEIKSIDLVNRQATTINNSIYNLDEIKLYNELKKID